MYRQFLGWQSGFVQRTIIYYPFSSVRNKICGWLRHY